ncbi:hypothetical protein [Leifsonia shinshuensis]|uniref:Site-specific integrase n=1 Tax=Leifsonia shinshuensis TaxID=150026 RepID=A0A7G6YBL6_9MICO|nr:hypothetical protein [Leifsonia shinshuensis]QNE35881.1 hypothetical protein F1C12_12585 [Leifsonia shinshuensis]
MTSPEFRPKLPPEVWQRVHQFVLSAVFDARGLSGYSDREYLIVVTKLAVWMTTRAGLPLDREIAFDPHTIDRFVMDGLPQYTKAGKGTMRSRLRRLSEALLPDLEDPARERPLGKSHPGSPYTDAEITTFTSWAHALPRRIGLNATRLLALGFGAGLIGTEFGHIQVSDLLVEDDAVTVRVSGDREREIPVFPQWTRPLRDCARTDPPDAWVFRDGRETIHRNVVTNFVEKHPPQVPLQARRMRATWIVAQLNAGTRLVPLLRMAGLGSAEPLDKYLPFVHEGL